MTEALAQTRGAGRHRVYQRSWLDEAAVTLRQIEIWLVIPDSAGVRWPRDICLLPIDVDGWQQEKRIVTVYHVRVDGAPDYGMIQYEGIGQRVRSRKKGEAHEVRRRSQG